MRMLVEDRLWTGNSQEARNIRAICDAGVCAVVDLAAEELAATLTRDTIYCRFPLVDGSANEQRLLQIAAKTVASLIKSETPTAVCCGAGMSRSLTIAVVGLAIARGEHPDKLLKSLFQEGAHDIAPALWQETLNACQTHPA